MKIYKESLNQLERHPGQKIFLSEIKQQLDCYLRVLEDRTDEFGVLYKEEINGILGKIEKALGKNLDFQGKERLRFKILQKDGVFASIGKTVQEIGKFSRSPKRA